MTSFHDPRREVEKLREHLASNETPIAFLIGAGASCAVRDPSGEPLVPAVDALGRLCAEEVANVGEAHAGIYAELAARIEAARASSSRKADIEEILSAVRLAIAAMGSVDLVAGGTANQLEEIEVAIRSRIAEAALPDESRFPASLPHHALGLASKLLS